MTVTAIIILLCVATSVMCFPDDDLDPLLTSGYLRTLGKRAGSKILELLGTAFADIERTITKQLRDMPMDTVKGKKFQNATFHNHVCDLMECTDWSDWSPCVYEGREAFGYATKYRDCGFNTTLCTYPAEVARNETRSKVCSRDRLQCPHNYQVIHAQGQRFCLRYEPSSTQQHVAAANCFSEGAHIVNLNTGAKIEAVDTLLGSSRLTIWVNGLRTNPYDPWEYTYGGAPELELWASGEPSNSYSQNCKVEEDDPRRLYDRDCDYSYQYVCEYV